MKTKNHISIYSKCIAITLAIAMLLPIVTITLHDCNHHHYTFTLNKNEHSHSVPMAIGLIEKCDAHNHHEFETRHENKHQIISDLDCLCDHVKLLQVFYPEQSYRSKAITCHSFKLPTSKYISINVFQKQQPVLRGPPLA